MGKILSFIHPCICSIISKLFNSYLGIRPKLYHPCPRKSCPYTHSRPKGNPTLFQGSSEHKPDKRRGTRLLGQAKRVPQNQVNLGYICGLVRATMNVGDTFIPRSVHHGHKFYATTNNLLNIVKRIQLEMQLR